MSLDFHYHYFRKSTLLNLFSNNASTTLLLFHSDFYHRYSQSIIFPFSDSMYYKFAPLQKELSESMTPN